MCIVIRGQMFEVCSRFEHFFEFLCRRSSLEMSKTSLQSQRPTRMLFAFFPPNFDILLVTFAFAASRPRARRTSRSLATEWAPDGTGPAGSTDASSSVPAAGKFRGASGRGLPGSGLREQADFSVAEDASPRVLLLASRMPVPKPDALNWSRIQLACFWRELWATCIGASLALEVTRISSKFLLIFSSRSFRTRYACQCSRAYSSSFSKLLKI